MATLHSGRDRYEFRAHLQVRSLRRQYWDLEAYALVDQTEIDGCVGLKAALIVADQ